MNKYIRFPGFKLKAVTLSYDDGVRQDIYIDYIDKKCIVSAGKTIKIGDWNAGDWSQNDN